MVILWSEDKKLLKIEFSIKLKSKHFYKWIRIQKLKSRENLEFSAIKKTHSTSSKSSIFYKCNNFYQKADKWTKTSILGAEVKKLLNIKFWCE